MDAAKGNAVTKGSIDSISGGSCIGQAGKFMIFHLQFKDV